MSQPTTSGQELPLEVILSLQRILDLQHGDHAGAFDGVASQFDTVGFLNQLFPTGQLTSGTAVRIDIDPGKNSGGRGISRGTRGCAATSG